MLRLSKNNSVLVSKIISHLRLSMFSYGLILANILTFLPRTSHAEFAPLQEDDIKPCKLQLSQAKHIPHRCNVISDRTSDLKVWQGRLSFDFGKLSKAEFQQLKNIYGGAYKSKSLVYYNPSKHYQLIDFLPPIIQALNNHRFIPESTVVKSEKDLSQQLYMNCWGVVYEVLRSATDPLAKPSLFMGQGSIMLDLLRDNSARLLTFNEPNFFIADSKTEPGDIVLIMHTSSTNYQYLDHIAIAIDDGIYFEKAGTGADVPIRIIDEATLRQIWQPGVFDYEIRRLKPNAKLPHPQTIFSLNAPEIQSKFSDFNELPVNIANSTSIMWEEEAKDINTSSLFHLVNTLPIYLNNTGKANLASKLYQQLLAETNPTK